MLIGRRNEHLVIEVLERLPDDSPTPGDLRGKVSLKLREFTGCYSGVWLAKPDLNAFVEQLEALETSRSGSAKLEAMSPDELTLELRSMDDKGHFEAAVQLGRYQYSGDTDRPTRISGGFIVDPDQLPAIMTAFRNLLG